MTELGYIYPQFYFALNKLSDALKLSNKQHEILNKWFHAHVFNLGADYSVDSVFLEKSDPDRIEEYVKERQAHALSNELIRNGLFMQEITDPQFNWKRTYRVSILVFGDPRLGVQPGTRERGLP